MNEHNAPTVAASRGGWWRYAVVTLIVISLGGLTAVLAANGTLKRWFGRQQGNSASTGQLWTCGMHPQVIQDHRGECPICHMELTPLKAAAGTAKAARDRKVKYWWDPMLGPSSISDKPGKSAMGMDLVPVYEEAAAGPEVVIDPVIVQNMGVRTAQVTRGPLQATVRAVGLLKEAEPNVHDVNLRLSGWVEKLHANTEGMHVSKGDPLFDLYSPQLQTAVEELLAARRGSSAPGGDQLASRSMAALYESAERKLVLLGLTEEQVENLAKLDGAPRTVTFTSPISGHVTEKSIVEGAAVKEGERTLRIVDHSTLWLDAQVYESQLPFIKQGQKARATIASLPGKNFEGEVTFVHPHVDPATRTVMVRLVVPNESLDLKPGMYATVLIVAELADQVVLVPREAVIDTGIRQIAFLARDQGHFEPREVRMGVMGQDGMVQVLQGLEQGETVVTSGQFLIDAQSRMQEAIQKHRSAKLAAGGKTAEGPSPATAPTPAPAAAANPAKGGMDLANVDAVVRAYLGLSDLLGKSQAAEQPADVQPLIAASQELVATVSPEHKPLAEKLSKAAAVLKGQPIQQQRKLFKPLSAAVIALVDQAPPSKSVAQKLLVMHCPMADENRGADWLQSAEPLANPYFATSMKQCGSVERTIEGVPVRP